MKTRKGKAARPKAQSEALCRPPTQHAPTRLRVFFWDLVERGISGERAKAAFDAFADQIGATEADRAEARRSLCNTVEDFYSPPWGRMVGE